MLRCDKSIDRLISLFVLVVPQQCVDQIQSGTFEYTLYHLAD